eukprot:1158298-Pelagomonas_calceolata.AAC.5
MGLRSWSAITSKKVTPANVAHAMTLMMACTRCGTSMHSAFQELACYRCERKHSDSHDVLKHSTK